MIKCRGYVYVCVFVYVCVRMNARETEAIGNKHHSMKYSVQTLQGENTFFYVLQQKYLHAGERVRCTSHKYYVAGKHIRAFGHRN